MPEPVVPLGDYRTNFGPFPSHSRINGVTLPATPRYHCLGLVPSGVGLNGAIGPAAVTHGCQRVFLAGCDRQTYQEV